jgi:hypothetical protein
MREVKAGKTTYRSMRQLILQEKTIGKGRDEIIAMLLESGVSLDSARNNFRRVASGERKVENQTFA